MIYLTILTLFKLVRTSGRPEPQRGPQEERGLLPVPAGEPSCRLPILPELLAQTTDHPAQQRWHEEL